MALVAGRGGRNLRQVVVQVALQRERGAQLATHVEQYNARVVRQQYVREDGVAVDDIHKLVAPLAREARQLARQVGEHGRALAAEGTADGNAAEMRWRCTQPHLDRLWYVARCASKRLRNFGK